MSKTVETKYPLKNSDVAAILRHHFQVEDSCTVEFRVSGSHDYQFSVVGEKENLFDIEAHSE